MPVLHRLSLCAATAAFTLWGLAGCASADKASLKVASVLTPYKLTIVQGNVVTREQVAYLKIGMPRATVRDVLGTPLLTSVFHADRWDYVFTFKRQGVPEQSRRVTVFFSKDALERIEADELPSEQEFVSTLHADTPTGKPAVLEASEESLKKFPPPAPKPVPTQTAPDEPVKTYPPLEPAPAQ